MADVAINADAANIPAINFGVQGSDPTAPGSGRCLLYIKSGGVYVRYNGGSATAVGGTPALAEGQLAVGDGSGNLSALALGSEGQLVTADASGFATWADAPEGGSAAGASHIPFVYWAYTAYGGSAPVTAIYSSGHGGGYVWNTATVADEWIEWSSDVLAGTYTVRIWHGKTSSLGIHTVTFDGSTLGTFDGYTAGGTYNHLVEYTDVVVSTGGWKSLRFTCATKNASSSGYRYFIQAAALIRTA